jgi:NAD(P)-dependent dehydrogenase (short-subunit alcohol dehydrogenase family)
MQRDTTIGAATQEDVERASAYITGHTLVIDGGMTTILA